MKKGKSNAIRIEYFEGGTWFLQIQSVYFSLLLTDETTVAIYYCVIGYALENNFKVFYLCVISM